MARRTYYDLDNIIRARCRGHPLRTSGLRGEGYLGKLYLLGMTEFI